MFMVQDLVFMIIIEFLPDCLFCLSPFEQQPDPSNSFFQFGIIHRPVERAFHPVSKFLLSIEIWVRCILNLMTISLVKPPSHYFSNSSCSFLKAAVSYCHDNHYCHREDIQLVSSTPFPHMDTSCF